MPKPEPLESTISNNIIKAINAIEGCRVKKFHGSAFGRMELDIYGCCRGRAVFIEVKRPSTIKNTSARQDAEIKHWQEVGAIAGVVCTKEGALELIAPALNPQN